MTVEVRFYTDPVCTWSWGAEPALRRLLWDFEGELSFSWVMGGSNASIEAFAADLDEVRDPPQAACDAGAVRRTEGHERTSFPSAIFIGADGERHGAWGTWDYDCYRAAALAAGASPQRARAPATIEAVERFGRCATREIEELTRRSRPLAEAELWKPARDWKLKPVPALTGTLWEIP
jgi:hypothetical protein